MEKEKVFADGIIFKAPDQNTKDKAPWVKGKISVKVTDFIAFLNKHNNDGWVNLDLKKSKEKGTLYLELNTYKKAKEDDLKLDDEPEVSKYPEEPIKPEDIPFN